MEDTPLEDFSAEYYNIYLSILSPIDAFCREQREHHVFERLLESHPGLLERLKNGSDEDILHVGELVYHSVHGQSPYLRFIDWQGSRRRARRRHENTEVCSP
jgi:hypothetical protein